MSLEIDGGSAREYWTLDSSSYGEVSQQLEQAASSSSGRGG